MTPDLQALLADVEAWRIEYANPEHTNYDLANRAYKLLVQLAAAVREMAKQLPAEHERFVRCSREFVAQLLAEPSPPVCIIKVEERNGGELYFAAQVHECPATTPPSPVTVQEKAA